MKGKLTSFFLVLITMNHHRKTASLARALWFLKCLVDTSTVNIGSAVYKSAWSPSAVLSHDTSDSTCIHAQLNAHTRMRHKEESIQQGSVCIHAQLNAHTRMRA